MFVQQILQNLVHFLPETALTVTFCIAILAGIIFRKTPKVVGWISFVGVAVALFFAIQQAGVMDSVFRE